MHDAGGRRLGIGAFEPAAAARERELRRFADAGALAGVAALQHDSQRTSDAGFSGTALPDGALLNLFASLYDGSDTRRNPEANKSWYQSTGTWTEQEAVSETFRLMEQLDIPTNQVVSHKFHGSSVGVEDLSGNKVRVTPFYTVQMSKDAADEDNSFLNVEYRIDQNPPGKVTRLFCWPPVKVP